MFLKCFLKFKTFKENNRQIEVFVRHVVDVHSIFASFIENLLENTLFARYYLNSACLCFLNIS